MAYCVVSIPIIYPQMNMIFSRTLVVGRCRQQDRLNDCTIAVVEDNNGNG